LGGKGQYSAASYLGWSVKRLPAGEHDNETKGGSNIIEKGGRRRPFNFSGTTKTLPELHRGLRKVMLTATSTPFPTVSEALKLARDATDMINVADYGQQDYLGCDVKIFRFDIYSLYVEETKFCSKGENKEKIT
jgi:hypothetical protein